MMSGRDASGRIIPQARQLIDQLYEKINAQYRGVKPNLIFVCHSMGGLTMRYILTSPNDPIDGASLSARQKERAAWLRDRTLYVTTLATPHEGSPLPAKMQNVRQFLREKSSFLTPALKLIGLKNPDPVGIVTNTLGVTPALDHLRQDFCTAMNQGQLAPHKMTRSDGSLIPVYTMGGRTPGGSFFNDADQYPTGGIEIEADMERELKAIGLMMLDWSVHNVPSGARSWGSAINVPGMDLDDCERGNKRLGLTYVSPPSKIPAAGLEGLPLFYLRNKNDGELDTDGMVGIQSALGIRLGTSLNLYFDHRQSWNVDGRRMDGSWYRVPTGPWDRTNHDTICNRMGIGRWLRENIILRAGPLPARTGSTSVWPAGS